MGIAELHAFITFNDHQLAMAQLFQLAQYRTAQQAGTNDAAGTHHMFGGGQARAFHGGRPLMRGGRRGNHLQRPGG